MPDLQRVVAGWSSSESEGKRFPMFTIPLKTFLQMTKVQEHEDLMDAKALCEFHEAMGKAMFVSHQWISKHNPDPKFQQLEVLQKALKNLLAGTSTVCLPPAIELWVGRLKCPTAADFQRSPLFLWYDYFCCPQGNSASASRHRRLAIGCIPSYVARCFFFIVLCPAVQHEDGHTLSHSSWEERGWCRMEQMARELARNDGFIITVQTATHPSLAWNMHGVGKAPGNGEFSFEVDRERVGRVILRMVWTKLQYGLANGELHNYRFLLSLHRKHFEGVPGLHPVEGLVSGFQTEIDPSDDPGGFLVARFLHDNIFRKVTDRDSHGWSPLCFAVVQGNPSLVKALLDGKADANDSLLYSKKEVNLPRNIPVLSLATAYHNNEVVKVLISAHANVDARCGYRGTALCWAAASDNAFAVRILCEANADPRIKVFPDTSPFRLACAIGSVKTMKEMLIHFPVVSLRFCLHVALVFFGAGDMVSSLIEAAADINEQLRVPPSRVWWSILKMLHVRHYVSPSALTYLAYHHYGATPLIVSILAGKLDATAILLKAGANMDIRNDRGKSATSFIQEMRVNVPLLDALSQVAAKNPPYDGEEDDSFSV